MDTTVQVSLITSLGLVIVAAIGVITARITTGAKRDAEASSADASKSAQIAKDFAAALGAKDALILSLNTRVEYLEHRDKECTEEVEQLREDLKQRDEENKEQQRDASILERERTREILELRKEIDTLKAAH